VQGAAKLDWNIHDIAPWMNLQNSSLSAGGTSYSVYTGFFFYGGWGVKLTFRPLYSAEVKKEGEPLDASPRPTSHPPRRYFFTVWTGTALPCYYAVMFLNSSATRGAGSEVQGGALAQPLSWTFNNSLNNENSTNYS